MTTPTLPPWPAEPPRHGGVCLRKVRQQDAAMAQELSTDPYVPLIGSLPPHATPQQAAEWILRQQNRHSQGSGFSFTIADRVTDEALGHCNLGLTQLSHGRGAGGYSVRPSQRGRGIAASALIALTRFGWTLPGLHRIELYIEPWIVDSVSPSSSCCIQVPTGVLSYTSTSPPRSCADTHLPTGPGRHTHGDTRFCKH